jgi:hypothetical protein
MRKLSLFIALITTLLAITPADYQKKLKIGINVNWCNFNKYVKNEYYKIGSKEFAKLGFKHVRIRFNGKLYEKNPEIMLKCLKSSVNSALQNNLIPIITYTNENFAQNPNKKNLNFSVNVWKTIAETFKNYPQTVTYDLYIEPNKKLGKRVKKLLKFYKKSITEIRKIDTKKMIFIAPPHIANPYYLNDLLPIVKNKKLNKNILIEWHFYAAGPSKTNKKKLWKTGSAYEKKLIDDKINYAYNWCEKYNLKSWVGAVMPGNYNHGDNYSYKDQINFITYIIKKLKEKNIPLAINAGQQFFDYKMKKLKRVKVLKAILDLY